MARSNSKLDLLRSVPLFAGCQSKVLEEVSRLADEVDVGDGYVLIRQGTLGQQFVLIVDGRVRIERDGAAIATLGPGDFLGEIALIDNGPTTATATTEGPARLLVMGHQQFNTLLDTSPALRFAITSALARRIRHLEPDALH
jgi:CRP-like cAMP-binding protein